MSLDNNERASLCNAADQAAARAYSPYSKFRVGAAVLGDTIHVGVNVENSTFGASLCAERAALAAAWAAGDTQIRGLAVAFPDLDNHVELNRKVPCGICRQWLAELAPAAEIIICGTDVVMTLADLLPTPFKLTEE